MQAETSLPLPSDLPAAWTVISLAHYGALSLSEFYALSWSEIAATYDRSLKILEAQKEALPSV